MKLIRLKTQVKHSLILVDWELSRELQAFPAGLGGCRWLRVEQREGVYTGTGREIQLDIEEQMSLKAIKASLGHLHFIVTKERRGEEIKEGGGKIFL